MRIDLPSFDSPFGKLPDLACSSWTANQHPDLAQTRPAPPVQALQPGVAAKTGANAGMSMHVTTSFSLTNLDLDLF